MSSDEEKVVWHEYGQKAYALHLRYVKEQDRLRREYELEMEDIRSDFFDKINQIRSKKK